MADAIPLPFESEETWRPVVGHEGLYEVSDQGRVRRIAPSKGTTVGRVLRYAKDRKGYRRVTLSRDRVQTRFAVHHLVLEAFVASRPVGYECNHKDGNKHNNTPANLEWVTGKANMEHAARMGLRAPALTGERHPRAKLTAEQVAEIRGLRGLETKRATAARYGISDVHVGLIQAGKYWREVGP
jgi:hypothetical protein